MKKKLIAFTLLPAVMLFASQMFAQGEIKSNVNLKASDKKTDVNATDNKSNQNTNTGGFTKSGQQIPAPPSTLEPTKDPSGNVVSEKPTTYGTIIYDRMGQKMFYIGTNGMVFDSKGNKVGQYTTKGEYLGPDGTKLGSIRDGVIRTTNEKVIGRLSKDGKVTNAKGKLKGTIYEDGTIRNSKGTRLGSAPGVDMNISAMIFFHKKPSSGERKRNQETKPGFEMRPIQN